MRELISEARTPLRVIAGLLGPLLFAGGVQHAHHYYAGGGITGFFQAVLGILLLWVSYGWRESAVEAYRRSR